MLCEHAGQRALDGATAQPVGAAMKTGAGSPRLLDVRGLSVRFFGDEGIVTAVDDVSFALSLGETLCLLGESGCGKTVTMRSLMRLLPGTAKISGSVRLDDVEVTALQERELLAIRGSKVAMVFQDPMSALDPVFTIGQQIVEVVMTHEGVSRAAARARALELLEMVQIPSAQRRLDAFPHELSGGLRQRAMIALALSCRPSCCWRSADDRTRRYGSDPDPHLAA